MVQPYYERAGITIYHGDCREILPYVKADVVVTDPPYGSRRPPQHSKRGAHEEITGNEAVDTAWINLLQVSDGGAIYSFCTWDTLEQWRSGLARRFRVRSCIVWDKEIHGLADLETCWAPRHELILFAANGRHELAGSRPVDVIRCQRADTSSHPYAKPTGLIRRILTASVGDTVLDPFLGSGTTLVAAKLEGRKAIGIEIEERYCEIAAKRLAQGVLEFGGPLDVATGTGGLA